MKAVNIYITAGRNRDTGMVFWCGKMTYGPHFKRKNGTFTDEMTSTSGGILSGLASMISSLKEPAIINVFAGKDQNVKEISQMLSKTISGKEVLIPNLRAIESVKGILSARGINKISYAPTDGSIDAIETDDMLEAYRISCDNNVSMKNKANYPHP